MAGLHDLTGKVYDYLIVLARAPNKNGRTRWKCRCKCGTELDVDAGNLVSGNSRSCGCRNDEVRRRVHTKHGCAPKNHPTPEYRTWQNILSRCHNPNCGTYYKYGAKGVAVCRRWQDSFAAFLQDMGHRPTSEHSIERIRNAEGYSPENCRWATRQEQARNKTTARLITADGQTLPLVVWAEKLGMNHSSILGRISRGWTEADAVTVPAKR